MLLVCFCSWFSFLCLVGPSSRLFQLLKWLCAASACKTGFVFQASCLVWLACPFAVEPWVASIHSLTQHTLFCIIVVFPCFPRRLMDSHPRHHLRVPRRNHRRCRFGRGPWWRLQSVGSTSPSPSFFFPSLCKCLFCIARALSLTLSHSHSLTLTLAFHSHSHSHIRIDYAFQFVQT